ncbi:MAG: hypothetical protein ACT4OS_08020 [Acidimicrobiales bacterium]
MGFNPTRKVSRSGNRDPGKARADRALVAAALVVTLALLLWALL